MSPSDAYWEQQELQQQQQQTVQIQGNSYNLGSLLNGGVGDGQILLQQHPTAMVNNVVPIGQHCKTLKSVLIDISCSIPASDKESSVHLQSS